jgi:ferric iron reductase protein FhuF
MLKSILITANAFAFFFLISCSNKTETKAFTRQDISEVKAELTVKSKLDEAKEVFKTISEINSNIIWVNHAQCRNFSLQQLEQFETKQMTRKELDLIIMPLQSRLDSLSFFLTAEEKNELKAYKPILFNELIDAGVVNKILTVEPRYSLQ